MIKEGKYGFYFMLFLLFEFSFVCLCVIDGGDDKQDDGDDDEKKFYNKPFC